MRPSLLSSASLPPSSPSRLRRVLWVCSLGCALLSWNRAARAEVTRFVEVEGFAKLLDGDPQSVSLAEDGTVSLAPALYTHRMPPHVALGAATVWQRELVAARLDTPHGLVAIDAKGRMRPLMEQPSGVITRVFDGGDALWVASGPNARLDQIDARGKGKTQAAPEAAFIWDMARAQDGALIAATGIPGAIWRQNKKGSWDKLWQSEEAHLKTLAIDSKLGFLVGGGERGVVYRAADGKNFRAIYDTQSREVTALAVSEGVVWAAGVTGAQAAAASEEATSKVEVRSRLLRITPDGAAELLAGSTDVVIFAIAPDVDGQILVATGAAGKPEARGRLYRIEPHNRSVALVHQSDDRRITQLLSGPNRSVWALSQEGAHLVELLPTLNRTGVFVSAVADLGVSSQLGLAQVIGELPAGSDAVISTRSGHTAQPDTTWSPWSPGIAADQPGSVDSPPGRFVQLRLTLSGRERAVPRIYRLRLAYLRHNVAPVVREISAMDKGVAVSALPANMGQEEGGARIGPLFDKSEESEAKEMLRRLPVRVRQAHETGATTIRWQADDANGDELEYALWARRHERADWQLIREHSTEPFYTFSAGQLPDGHYIFRVRASDVRSNPETLARSGQRDSRIVVIDNTPPMIEHLTAKRDGRFAIVTGEVADAVGPLTELTYSLDGQPARPIAPRDGILDGPRESMAWPVGPLAPGPHSIVVYVKDGAHNVSTRTVDVVMPRS